MKISYCLSELKPGPLKLCVCLPACTRACVCVCVHTHVSQCVHVYVSLCDMNTCSLLKVLRKPWWDLTGPLLLPYTSIQATIAII